MSKELTVSSKPEDKPTHDFTQEDLNQIELFKEGGLLGIATLTEVDITRMMDHYLAGKNYREIARTLKIKKHVIMFLSQKMKWYAMRREYVEELTGVAFQNRLMEAKLQSQEFLLNVTHALERKLRKAVDQFNRTDNPDDFKKIDMKEMDKYVKITETLHRLNAEIRPGFGDRPMVNINIEKASKDSVVVSPGKSLKGQVASRIKQFADMKRDMEKEQSRSKSDDIDVEVEGDEDENE